MRGAVPVLPRAMRDTALTVTELKLNAQPKSFSDFRERCESQVQQLRAELSVAGYSNAVIADAVYAQCALLDEFALIKLQGDEHESWEQDPLQVSEFQSHEAGVELVDRVERCLANPNTPVMLLAVFFETFNLGFKGKFMIAGEPARDVLLRALDARATRQSNPSLGLVNQLDAEHNALDKTPSISPRIIWGALVAMVTISIYCGLQLWTSTAVASLPI
jgi:type VI secretion system protein ImpK